MDIDHPGHDILTRGIDHSTGFFLQKAGFNGNNLFPFDSNISLLNSRTCDHNPLLDQKVIFFCHTPPPYALLFTEVSLIALTICEYPVHRQIFPRIYSRMSSSEGFGFSSRRDFPMRTIPGVQKPHWTAPCSRKDSWIGWRLPSRFCKSFHR